MIGSLKKSKKINLSKEESTAFHELLHNKNMLIRPVDKGSGIIVLDRAEYIASLEREVEQSSSCERLGSNGTEELNKKVKKLVDQMSLDRHFRRP